MLCYCEAVLCLFDIRTVKVVNSIRLTTMNIDLNPRMSNLGKNKFSCNFSKDRLFFLLLFSYPILKLLGFFFAKYRKTLSLAIVSYKKCNRRG